MPAGRHDFTMYQGATFLYVVEWQKSNGQPIAAGTAWVPYMSIKDGLDAESTLIDLNISNGRLTFSLGGVITIHLTPSDTADLVYETMVYDLIMYNLATGYIKPLLYGTVNLIKRVTVIT